MTSPSMSRTVKMTPFNFKTRLNGDLPSIAAPGSNKERLATPAGITKPTRKPASVKMLSYSNRIL